VAFIAETPTVGCAQASGSHSEAYRHLGVAGEFRTIEFVGARTGVAARILDAAGNVIVGQVLPEEVGISRDENGYFVRLS
jgi:hypothetical protein